MRKTLGALTTVAVLLVGLASCAPKRRLCVTFRKPVASVTDAVQVTFLGVGGFLVRWDGASVMTAPLYSGPSAAELALSDVHSDIERVDKLMYQDVSDARALLVGHSHYDHAMDVPFVALQRAKAADIIGNNALVKILAPVALDLAAKTPPTRIVSLEGQDPCGPGYDVAGTRFRVHALRSEHSPQIGSALLKFLFDVQNISLWRGEPLHPLHAVPTRVGQWPGGTTLAFVIDLLEKRGDDVAFRIYYQDSPTRTGVGYPPPCLQASKVDLAILTVAGSTELSRFPGDIVEQIDPQFVMGGHWESFFAPRPLPLPRSADVREEIWLAPGVSLSSFLRKVRLAQPTGGQAAVPCPEEVTTFTRGGTSWAVDASGTDMYWSKPKK